MLLLSSFVSASIVVVVAVVVVVLVVAIGNINLIIINAFFAASWIVFGTCASYSSAVAYGQFG